MKKFKKLHIVLFVLLCIVYYLLCGSPLVEWRNARLAEAIQNIESDTVTLEELVPFAWDAVYTFEPYTSREEIAKVIGFYSPEIKESVSDHVSYIFFTKGNRIVCNPKNRSDVLGSSIHLPNRKKDNRIGSGNSYLKYGDSIPFEIVSINDGTILWPAE